MSHALDIKEKKPTVGTVDLRTPKIRGWVTFIWIWQGISISMVLDVEEKNQPEVTTFPDSDRSSKEKVLDTDW